jgi:hypothetical protein
MTLKLPVLPSLTEILVKYLIIIISAVSIKLKLYYLKVVFKRYINVMYLEKQRKQ